MSESFRNYKVVETASMPAEELQRVLNDATDGFPEMQIDYVVGTKVILGYESLLNAKGRAEARSRRSASKIMANNMMRATGNEVSK